ncbi:hypothetical protein PAPYR_652 [Paratrimastix pyriformis]|uniref:Uncharacterized protein n=1 Tax=Paratrimastix pyriformis TaxID=342808 RepID=A0ABQ8UVQ0_9EUKA|nr:hypothetical protein PAPYR_652 [Paratrimastix pyriformis]
MSSPIRIEEWDDTDLRIPPSVPDGIRVRLRQALFQFAYSVGRWYPFITEFTFPTELVSVSVDEAKAIVIEGRRLRDLPCSIASSMTPDQVASALGNLSRRISAAITRLGGSSGVFIKLNSRSAKDVVFEEFHETLWNAMQAELHHTDLSQYMPSHSCPVPKLRELEETLAGLFIRQAQASMRVSDPGAAIDQLLRSGRIYMDLSKCLECVDHGLPFEAEIAVRAWDPTLLPSMEMRCYVRNKHLTAIAQYYDSAPLAWLTRGGPAAVTAIREALQERIRHFVEDEVAPKLPHKSFVVDVICRHPPEWEQTPLGTEEILPPARVQERVSTIRGEGPCPMRMGVVEINPFHKGAASLFAWRGPDRDILLHGFEMRLINPSPRMLTPQLWATPLAHLPAAFATRLQEWVTAQCMERCPDQFYRIVRAHRCHWAQARPQEAMPYLAPGWREPRHRSGTWWVVVGGAALVGLVSLGMVAASRVRRLL